MSRVLLFLLVVIHFNPLLNAASVRFDFDRLEYRFNPAMINVTAKVNDKKILNMDYTVVEKVNRLHVYFSFLDGKSYTNVIYNRSIDACKAFKGSSVTRFLLVIMQMIRKNANAPYTCPVPVGNYYIHDVDLGILNFPLGLPIGPVNNGVKCSMIVVSKLSNNTEIFIAEYNFYLKVIKKIR